MPSVEDSAQLASDPELITRVRAGDRVAFGDLYARHAGAAAALARQFAGSSAEADDLVSEAFARVLDGMLEGKGPDTAFRAYLFTTLRNTAYDRTRKDKRLQFTDDMDRHDVAVEGDDPVIADLENGLVAKAFAGLPERWQTVLWHTQVEGESAAEVGILLGMAPNAVSSLAFRAREGLREAYLQAHLAETAANECRTTVDRLGAWTRGGLSKRERGQVEAHLATCERCTALAAELSEINTSLRGLLAPLLLGGAAAGYVSTLGPVVPLAQLGAFTGASPLAPGSGGSATAGGNAAGSHAVFGAVNLGSWGSASVFAGVAAVVAVAVTAVVIALTSSGPALDAGNGQQLPAVVSGAAGGGGAGGGGNGGGSNGGGAGGAGAGGGGAGSGGTAGNAADGGSGAGGSGASGGASRSGAGALATVSPGSLTVGSSGGAGTAGTSTGAGSTGTGSTGTGSTGTGSTRGAAGTGSTGTGAAGGAAGGGSAGGGSTDGGSTDGGAAGTNAAGPGGSTTTIGATGGGNLPPGGEPGPTGGTLPPIDTTSNPTSDPTSGDPTTGTSTAGGAPISTTGATGTTGATSGDGTSPTTGRRPTTAPTTRTGAPGPTTPTRPTTPTPTRATPTTRTTPTAPTTRTTQPAPTTRTTPTAPTTRTTPTTTTTATPTTPTTATTAPPSPASLSVSAAVASAPVAGGSASVRVTITNTGGTASGEGQVIGFQLPAGVTIDSATSAPGASGLRSPALAAFAAAGLACSQQGTVASCTVPPIAAGAAIVVTVGFDVSADAVDGSIVVLLNGSPVQSGVLAVAVGSGYAGVTITAGPSGVAPASTDRIELGASVRPGVRDAGQLTVDGGPAIRVVSVDGAGCTISDGAVTCPSAALVSGVSLVVAVAPTSATSIAVSATDQRGRTVEPGLSLRVDVSGIGGYRALAVSAHRLRAGSTDSLQLVGTPTNGDVLDPGPISFPAALTQGIRVVGLPDPTSISSGCASSGDTVVCVPGSRSLTFTLPIAISFQARGPQTLGRASVRGGTIALTSTGGPLVVEPCWWHYRPGTGPDDAPR